MGGPRVTSGSESAQDQQTPAAFMAAVRKRFGPWAMDLAAHAGNTQHERYFAPEMLERFVRVDQSFDVDALIRAFFRAGAGSHAEVLVKEQVRALPAKGGNVRVPNEDQRAIAYDALKDGDGRRAWAPYLAGGYGWLNCEFGDAETWAEACRWNHERGASSLLLTPLTAARWYYRHIAGVADVVDLTRRMSFDGKHSFPKDLRLSYFWPGARGRVLAWDWVDDKIVCQWAACESPDTVYPQGLGTDGPGWEGRGSDPGLAEPTRSAATNARGVGASAAIPGSENDDGNAHGEDRTLATASANGPRTCEVVTRPGEQRPLFGGDD